MQPYIVTFQTVRTGVLTTMLRHQLNSNKHFITVTITTEFSIEPPTKWTGALNNKSYAYE